MFFFLLLVLNSWAGFDEDLAIKNKVKSLNSYSSYLKFEKEKKHFEKKREAFLKKRKNSLYQEEKREKAQDKAYILDFFYNVQFQDLNSKRKKLSSKNISAQEQAFLNYKNQQKTVSKKRQKAFLAYKQKHKKYEENRKKILAQRLKAISVFRDKKAIKKPPVF